MMSWMDSKCNPMILFEHRKLHMNLLWQSLGRVWPITWTVKNVRLCHPQGIFCNRLIRPFSNFSSRMIHESHLQNASTTIQFRFSRWIVTNESNEQRNVKSRKYISKNNHIATNIKRWGLPPSKSFPKQLLNLEAILSRAIDNKG